MSCVEWFQSSNIEEDLRYIAENKILFEKLRRELNLSFLVKFVINLRSYGLETESASWVPESDAVFINLLKMLLEKKGDKLQDFAQNLQLVAPVDKFLPDFKAFLQTCPAGQKTDCRKALAAVFGELNNTQVPTEETEAAYFKLQLSQCLSLTQRCASALAKLGANLSVAQQQDAHWNPPKLWQHSVPVAEPFETYLKARWGVKFPSLIGVSLEYLGWWNAPPRPKGMKIGSESSANATASSSSRSKQPKNDNLRPQTNKKEEEPKSWLPKQYQRGESFEPYFKGGILGGDFFGLFQLCEVQCKLDKKLNVTEPRNAMQEKWNFEEQTFCPALTGELGNGEVLRYENAALSTWACLWQHTSNYKTQIMLQRLHHSMQELWRDSRRTLLNRDAVQDWLTEVAKSAGMLYQSRKGREDKNEARRPSEVLLKPHILAQLPWNTALLQPWLAAALIIIQKFEMDSLELRHWPMSPEVEEVARELLSLVCHAKERIFFLLALYYKQVLQECREPRWFQLMMKEGVLPTIPALEMLCSGKASQILDEIKSLAWSEKKIDIKDMLYMNPQAYNPLPQLDDIFTNLIWHAKYWLTTDQPQPIPENLLRGVYPLEVLAELSKGEVPPPKTSAPASNPFSLQEKALFDHWYNKTADNYWIKHCPVDKRIGMIKEAIHRVEQEHWFSSTSLKPVKEIFTKPVGLQVAQELNDVRGVQSEKSLPMQLAIYSTLHFRFLGSCYGIHRENIEFGWLVRLSAEVLEREQLVRTAQVISLQLGVAPLLTGCFPYPRSCAELLGEVRAVSKQRDTISVDWLWSQLPSSWQQSVQPHEFPSDLISVNVRGLVLHFEHRLGAILGNVVRESGPVLDRGGEMFPNWYAIQCLMPLYIGELYTVASNMTAVTNLASLLHQLLLDMEEQFLQWTSGGGVAEEGAYEFESHYDPDLVVCFASVLNNQLENLLHVFVGRHVNRDTLPAFQEVHSQVKKWWCPMPIEEKKAKGQLLVCSAYCKIAVGHTALLINACQRAWKVTVPEQCLSDECNKCLKCLHFLSSVLEYMEATLDMFLLLNKYNFCAVKKHEWRRRLLIALSSGAANTIEEKEMWKHFSKVFRTLRGTRETIESEYFPPPYWTGFEASGVKEAVTTYLTGTKEQLDQLQRQLKISLGRICGNKSCKVKEKEDGSFVECSQCVKTKVDEPLAYCSRKCERKWWEKEHMAEHLERELGID